MATNEKLVYVFGVKLSNNRFNGMWT